MKKTFITLFAASSFLVSGAMAGPFHNPGQFWMNFGARQARGWSSFGAQQARGWSHYGWDQARHHGYWRQRRAYWEGYGYRWQDRGQGIGRWFANHFGNEG